jgi:hypothetical protein
VSTCNLKYALLISGTEEEMIFYASASGRYCRPTLLAKTEVYKKSQDFEIDELGI